MARMLTRKACVHESTCARGGLLRPVARMSDAEDASRLVREAQEAVATLRTVGVLHAKGAAAVLSLTKLLVSSPGAARRLPGSRSTTRCATATGSASRSRKASSGALSDAIVDAGLRDGAQQPARARRCATPRRHR